jgi:hypothetical protein
VIGSIGGWLEGFMIGSIDGLEGLTVGLIVGQREGLKVDSIGGWLAGLVIRSIVGCLDCWT